MDVNVHEAKAKLSELLNRMLRGERIYICRRNVRLAELKPTEDAPEQERLLGGAEGQVNMTHFFDPMTPEELAAWGYPVDGAP